MKGQTVFVELAHNEDPLLLGALTLRQVSGTQVFVAVIAFEGCEVEVVFAVRTHIGIVVLLGADHFDFSKITVLVHGSFYQQVLPVEDSPVFLVDLTEQRGTLSLEGWLELMSPWLIVS